MISQTVGARVSGVLFTILLLAINFVDSSNRIYPFVIGMSIENQLLIPV